MNDQGSVREICIAEICESACANPIGKGATNEEDALLMVKWTRSGTTNKMQKISFIVGVSSVVGRWRKIVET